MDNNNDRASASTSDNDLITLPENHCYHNRPRGEYYYESFSRRPCYEYYLCHDRIDDNYKLHVKLGDTVAIAAEDSNEDHTPFTISWWVAEVLCIWKDKKEEVKLEVRWFNGAKDELQESNQVDTINVDNLLGPIRVFASNDELLEALEGNHPPLPTRDYVCNTFSHFDGNGRRKEKIDDRITDFSSEARQKRGIAYSKKNGFQKWRNNKSIHDETNSSTVQSSRCGMDDMSSSKSSLPSKSTTKKRKKITEDNIPSKSITKKRTKTTGVNNLRPKRSARVQKKIELEEELFHDYSTCSDQSQTLQEDEEENVSTFSNVNEECLDQIEEEAVVQTEGFFYRNKSTNHNFFKSISLPPSYDMFNIDGKTDKDYHWKLNIGNTVAVHMETSKDTEYPFLVPWGPAEIVTIWTSDGDEENACKKYSKERVQLEIRWIYRRHDLPKSVRSIVNLSEDLEEVFESDHIDYINASSLLSPVTLFSNFYHFAAFKNDHFNNTSCFPEIHYICCRRIWSVLRGIFMPCGDLDSRIERGRMHSTVLEKDPPLKLALKQDNAISSTTTTDATTSPLENAWKERFSNAISKLTLSSASYDASLTFDALPCREDKIEQIQFFLESNLRPQSQDVTVSESDKSCPCFFIAGPPGTGKTACVLHVINLLKHKSSQGHIPSFDFVNINAMTVSHPFDVYILLWEAISSQKRNHTVAHAKLDAYFSSSNDSHRNCTEDTTSKTTVLLLDEIDYLLTPKQVVLYNLFNWPLLNLDQGGGNKLIVIGISNTINLPELLLSKVRSRLGRENCIFRSYSDTEIQTILQRRLLSIDRNSAVTSDDKDKNYSVFNENAVKFASKKASAMSGDVRYAFQICRSAAEAVLTALEAGDRNNDHVLVKTIDIQNVCLQSAVSPFEQLVASVAPYQVLVIVCMAALKKSLGREGGWFSLDEILTKMEGVTGALGDKEYFPLPTFDETIEILTRLSESGLILFQTPKVPSIALSAAGCCIGKWPRTLVKMIMHDFEVSRSLKDSTLHKPLVERYMGSCPEYLR